MTTFKNNNGDNIDPKKVEAIIEKYGLYWAVKKEALQLPDGTETDFFATVRQDTRKTFAAVKDSYEVFQNWELAELVLKVAGHLGTDNVRGGSFDDGGKVYLQIEQEPARIANDTVRRWASGINSFDGSTALKWGGTNLTVSCRNSFWAVYKDLGTNVRHTTNMREMVEQSLRAVERIQEAEKSLFETFLNFSHTDVKGEQIHRVIELVTGVDVNTKRSEAKEKYSTRALNTAKTMSQDILTEIEEKGENLWGLWSGVTKFTTHHAGSDRTRNKSKALGSLNRTDVQVLNAMKEMIYS